MSIQFDSRIMISRFLFYSRGVIDSYSVVHIPIRILPAFVMPVILSIRPMQRYTHF